jgi:hypothetical protein
MISARPSPALPAGETFVLRCADVHPCRCDKVFSGPSPRRLVAEARRHGELVHFFTPVFYSPERLTEMTRVAASVW